MSENKISEPVLKIKHENGSENVYYSVIYKDFPEEFRHVAERELNETDDNRRQGLQRLKDFMKKENIAFLEDYVLLAVLRCCKFNFKKSEIKLKKFVNKRREIVDMLREIDTVKIENILDDFCFGILPYRDKYGRVIVYTRPYGLNLDNYDFRDVAVVFITSLLFFLKYPISTVSGFVYFGECKSPSLYLFYPIFKNFKELMFHALSFPIRMSRFEIFNENKLCQYFYRAMSPFISKKLLSRISLHGSGYHNLHKLYDPNMLPEEFGGTLGPLCNKPYRQKLLDFVMELKEENA